MSSVSYVIPVFNKSKFLKPVINSLKVKMDLLKKNIYLLMTVPLISHTKFLEKKQKRFKKLFYSQTKK